MSAPPSVGPSRKRWGSSASALRPRAAANGALGSSSGSAPATPPRASSRSSALSSCGALPRTYRRTPSACRSVRAEPQRALSVSRSENIVEHRLVPLRPPARAISRKLTHHMMTRLELPRRGARTARRRQPYVTTNSSRPPDPRTPLRSRAPGLGAGAQDRPQASALVAPPGPGVSPRSAPGPGEARPRGHRSKLRPPGSSVARAHERVRR